jgi:hypothetical protein
MFSVLKGESLRLTAVETGELICHSDDSHEND